LAVTEAVQLGAREDENAHNLVFDLERRKDERAQAALNEAVLEGTGDVADVGLVDEFAANGASETVGVDSEPGAVGAQQIAGQRFVLQPDAGELQHLLGAVIEAQAGEFDGELVLETANDDLKDAVEILALADGAG